MKNVLTKTVLLGLLLATGLATAAPFGYSVNSDSIDVATSDSLYQIDLATGSETWRGKVADLSDIEGLAFSPAGQLFAADDESRSIFIVDQDTGTINLASRRTITNVATQGNDFGMAFGCSGALYLASLTQRRLYQIDPASGQATSLGSFSHPIIALASFGPDDALFGLGVGVDQSGNPQAPNLYSLNPNTGASTLIGPLGAEAAPYTEAGLAFSSDGQLWAITDRTNVNGSILPSQILRINQQTGTATLSATTQSNGFESLAMSVPSGCQVAPPPTRVPAVPTPALSTWALLILAFACMSIGLFWQRKVS